ncbi:MAG: hypothetical protein ACFFDS_01325 [Candidatus Thorarchaeota archaeon]
MILKNKLFIYGLISLIAISSIGLGVYFGIFFEKENGADNEIILTLEGSTSTKNYTLSDIMSFPNITGYAGYRKSTGTLVGPNLYKGVELNVLLDEVGGLASGEELEIIAADDYKVTFTSEMLNGEFSSYDNETGDYLGIGEFRIILAYEIDGIIDTSGAGILRIVAITVEGEDYYSDSSFWVKEVVKMKVTSESSWIVYLYGVTNDSIDKPTFEAFMHVNDSELRLSYQILDGDRTNTFEGLALWRIISLFDGGSETTFNESLATAGYDVILKNSTAGEITLRSEDIATNDSYILAAMKNSMFLKSSDAPLMLVGPGVASLQMINNIVEIWIVLE